MPAYPTQSKSGKRVINKLPWRRILVPIDFSKSSLRALDVAVPLALDCGAELFFLSVIEPSVYATGMEGVIVAVPDNTLIEEAKSNLPKIVKRFVSPLLKTTTLVERGKAFDIIVQVARKRRIDLIVMMTHGRTGMEHIFMGSTAERVVRHAKCPVFILRSYVQKRRKQQRRQRKD